MPKNKVSDLITGSGNGFCPPRPLWNRAAAQAAGIHPDTAAYTNAKPRVRAYVLKHRAAMQQQLVEQETDLSRQPRRAVGRAVEGLRRLELRREQALARLWEIAEPGPEMTRGSITGQVKAFSMIVAMESLIPDRRAGSSEPLCPAPLSFSKKRKPLRSLLQSPKRTQKAEFYRILQKPTQMKGNIPIAAILSDPSPIISP